MLCSRPWQLVEGYKEVLFSVLWRIRAYFLNSSLDGTNTLDLVNGIRPICDSGSQLRRKDNVGRESRWYYSIIENCHANSQPSISTTSSRCCPFDRHNFLCAKAGKFLRGPLRIGPIAFPQKLMLLVAINALGLALAYAALAVIEVHSKRSCESWSRLPIPDLRPDVLALGNHPSGHRDSIPTNSEQRISSRRAIPPAAEAITFSPRFSDLNNISQRPSASLCIPKRPLSPPEQSLQA